MPGMSAAVLRSRRQHQRQICQRFIVTTRELLTATQEGFCLLQLVQTQARSQIGHVVFEAWGDHFVVPGGLGRRIAVESVSVDAMQPHDARACSDSAITRDEHASLARRERLGRVEAEYSDSRIQAA